MHDKYIAYFISRTKKKISRFIEKRLIEKDLGILIPSYGNILVALYENGGKLAMKELADIIGKDKSTVTCLVNKLLDMDYIKKDKCIEDNRISYITLTGKGNEIQNKFDEISDEIYQTAYKGFTEEEKETLLRLLKKLNNNFGSENT